MTSDPIGLAGGFNTYAYVENNPLANYDYYGLAPRKGGKIMKDLADLLDTSKCDWWPASCLSKCVRWRCKKGKDSECQEDEYYYIGKGEAPYFSSPSYDPDKDKDCVCVEQTIRGRE